MAPAPARTDAEGQARESRGPADLVIAGADAGVKDELLHGLQGDDLGAGDDLLAPGAGPAHQRSQGRHRDHVQDGLGGVDHLRRHRQVVGRGTTDIPTGVAFDQQLGPGGADLGPPGVAVPLGQGRPGPRVAGDHHPGGEAAVAERRHHRLGHAPAAEHGEAAVHRDPPVGQELGDGEVVGVVGAQPPVAVHDRVHRPDRLRRAVELVDQLEAGLLEGHRDAAPRMPRARIPATAAARSVVVNALYT